MLSLRHQFFLIDGAKVGHILIRTKLFKELFAHTALFLDISQRIRRFLDLRQITIKKDGCLPIFN